MRFAIIAAGEGSRLVKEGIDVPKPLVKVGGECLIDRLIRIFSANGASEIVIITRKPSDDNDPMAMVSRHITEIMAQPASGATTAPIIHLEKVTPSSMHSFHEIAPHLLDESFVMTTVDTIFREDEFCRYVETFRESTADALMGVTDYIDDEKPLYISGVETMEQGETFPIADFLDIDSDNTCRYISGGIYGLKSCAIDTLNRCMESGKSRMRNFQRALISDGLNVVAYPFSKVLDIDHNSDITKAEEFLSL